MGHSHSSHEHDHSRKTKQKDTEAEPFRWKLPDLRSKTTLARLVLAALCSIALPLIRRQSRVELAVLGFVSLFLGAVEVGKFLLGQIQVQFSGLHRSWATHRYLEEHMPALSSQAGQAAQESDGVTWVGIWVNIALSAFKLMAGVVGRSSAMIADAGHSLSDLVSDGVTLWAVRIARLPPDEDHPYGHGRFEAVGAFLIATMLVAAGYGLGNHSYESLIKALPLITIPALGIRPSLKDTVPGAVASVPGKIALVAAVVSIISKELLYQATAKVGERLNSQVLIANAWHHRSDALSSCIAVVGIGGACLGLPVLDPLAGLLVAAMLSLTGLQVGWESVNHLTDTADTELVREIGDHLKEVEGVLGYCNLRARRMGSKTLVDVRIQCNPYISANAAYQISQRARWHVLSKMPSVADVLVTTATEDKPCPVVLSLPTTETLQQQIGEVLSGIPAIKATTKVLVSYKDLTPSVDVFFRVDEQLNIVEAKAIAEEAASCIRKIKNIGNVELHLDLSDVSSIPAGHLPGIVG